MKSGSRDHRSSITEGPRHERPRLGLGLAFVVSSAVVIAFAFTESVFADEADPRPTITVLVDNYTQTSPATLAEAEREAGRILGEAGVRAVWLECREGQSTGPQATCQKASEPTDIRLRILPAPIQNWFQDAVFGFTVHPVLASVYYEYAVRLAKRDDVTFDVPIILGCVIAHEIGHLLLGPNSHSAAGIMQAQWESKEVRQIMMGILLFTSQQSKLMRAQAQTRMRLQTASLKERQRTATVNH